MATCSPNDLVQAGKEFLALNSIQSDAVMLQLLCQILQSRDPMATCNVESLMASAACFTCLTPHQMMAVQTQLLCEILQGGGSGETCIVCLDDDLTPVDPGPCECSICYNQIGQFWFWNNLTTTWNPIAL